MKMATALWTVGRACGDARVVLAGAKVKIVLLVAEQLPDDHQDRSADARIDRFWPRGLAIRRYC
jgi:hypothetical protein